MAALDAAGIPITAINHPYLLAIGVEALRAERPVNIRSINYLPVCVLLEFEAASTVRFLELFLKYLYFLLGIQDAHPSIRQEFGKLCHP